MSMIAAAYGYLFYYIVAYLYGKMFIRNLNFDEIKS